MNMSWDRIEGNWKQFKGNVRQQCGKQVSQPNESTLTPPKK
jgi:uncharacterized protein YjbJ (UPF0337 family)